MIKSSDLINLLELQERIKNSGIDMAKFTESKLVTSPQLSTKLAVMTKEVEELIQSFDLTGDRLLSPEEFFNIIMFAYE